MYNPYYVILGGVKESLFIDVGLILIMKRGPFAPWSSWKLPTSGLDGSTCCDDFPFSDMAGAGQLWRPLLVAGLAAVRGG